MKPDFIVHNLSDSVGVVVVDVIEKDKVAEGWIMENDSKLKIKVLDKIFLGHKLSLSKIDAGQSIIKYGQDIGKAISNIKTGCHVHTHNVKTKRW